MEQLRASNSSKVTVEYSDPSGIFSLVSDHIQQILPLRNLHWNSSSRPLRSISSLHVELIPAQGGSSYSGREDGVPTQTSSINNGASGNFQQSGPRSRQSAESKKERRHQIPGLRQTPYLKIYLLRCDDTETYKNVSRKLLRDWVRSHTPSIQSSASINKVDNHDAFEWLIIHVLLPNGEFSKGIHNSGISRGAGRGDRSSNTARWSARGSSTVLEKVRSDFNGTSKSATDRVAQVQLGEDLEVSAVLNLSNSTSDHFHDEKHGWGDLISKLKYLILASFDRRVSQYEDDIKEKDSQRKLPGWNFNTFFVLKEGLARGFESVGLVEDALTGYHELSAALRPIVDEQSTNLSAQSQTGLFRDFTDDLREEFIKATAALQQNQRKHDNMAPDKNLERQQKKVIYDFGALILDTDRKPYRDMILANDISAYEFLCYVFARQVSLLLRLANPSASHGGSPNGHSSDGDPSREIHVKADQSRASMVGEPGVQLLVLSEICLKAVEFINSVTRTIRNDLRTSVEELAHSDEGIRNLPEATRLSIVENLVASWTFSAAQCILKKTSTQSLSGQLEPFLRQFKSQSSDRSSFKENRVDAVESVKREKFPDRSSSLKSPTLGESYVQAKVPVITPLDVFQLLPPRSSQTGIQELAAQRAELTGLARRALGSLGLRKNLWRGNWNDLESTHLSDDEMDEVSLEDTMRDAMKSIGESFRSNNSLGTTGIRNQILCSALISKHSFYSNYEDLTASMLALCVMSGRQKSAEALTADIAAVRCHMGDYNAAASYFHQLAPFYAKDDWDSLEMSMLRMYAQCLQKTNRDEEYVRVGLKIVAKVVRENKSLFKVQPNIASKALGFSDLIFASRSLGEPISVSIDNYFGDISLDPYPKHYNDHDGFQLQLRLRNRTSQALEAEQIRVQIVSSEEDQQSNLWLAADGMHILAPGAATILVGTKITIPGWYIINKIIVRSGHILFSQDLSSFRRNPPLIGSKDSVSLDPLDSVKQARILVWPSMRALEARLSMHNNIHLEQPRSVDIEISTGWNHISHGRVFLRAGSAGLRLRTAKAQLTSGNTTMVDQSQPGILGFGELFAETNMVLRIPYDLETDLKEITIKVEVSYTTPMGDFIYACNPKISSLLPLGVNVQDTFQQDSLFSRFTINSANLIPLRISRCYIEDSHDFEVSSPSLTNERFDVFPRQPLSLMTKIRLKHRKGKSIRKGSAYEKLFLMIEYHALDQEILEALENHFSEALAASNLQDLVRLLVPVLLVKARSRLSIQGLEVIGLRREITLNTVVDNDWSTVLSGLRPERRGELSKWLLDWQEKSPVIPIPDVSEALKLQHLIVPVDIAHMGIIHTACLNLHYPQLKGSPGLECVSVGQPIPAELVIKHTRGWLTQTEPSPKSEELEFCYEMQANADTWLIGGRKKAHFSAKEDEISSFPLLLIPLRTGHLLYPSVDITESIPSGANDFRGEQKTLGKPSHFCETDYRSQGETLLVIPNLGSTTVSLENGHSGSGSWLVDSKAREQF